MIAPIYREISEKIKLYIQDQRLTGRLPGQLPLAKRFGVNPHTIGKALRVLADQNFVIIDGTRGTFVNEQAMSRPRYKVIGIVGLVRQEERNNIIDFLEPHASRLGYHLLGITGTQEFLNSHKDLFDSFPVDGFIFCYSSLTENIANYLRQQKIPLVVCNRRSDIPWLNTVDFNHESHFRQIFKYLHLLGHHRIGVGALPMAPEYWANSLWMKEICRDYMPYYDDELYFQLPFHSQDRIISPEEVKKDVQKMLQHFLNLTEPPTALIVHSYYMEELRRQLIENRFNIPQDISLVSWGQKLADDFTQLYLDHHIIWLYALKKLLKLFNSCCEPPEDKLIAMPFHIGSTSQAPAVAINSNVNTSNVDDFKQII